MAVSSDHQMTFLFKLKANFPGWFYRVLFAPRKERIDQLNDGIDLTNEANEDDLKSAQFIEFTSDEARLKEAKFIIPLRCRDEIKSQHIFQ